MESSFPRNIITRDEIPIFAGEACIVQIHIVKKIENVT